MKNSDKYIVGDLNGRDRMENLDVLVNGKISMLTLNN
jgi:hypothetical protein